MMHKIRGLIEKFWDNQLSGKEAAELDSLIKNDDAEFRNELEREFHQSVAFKEEAEARRRFGGLGKVVSINYGSRWGSVAAVLILLLVGAQLFNSKKTAVIVQSADHSIVKNQNNSNDIAEVKNKTGVDLQIHLPDGSVVALAPKSMVRYKHNFDNHNRNIQLTGKAVFKVAKDKKRPFSVITEGYATTALGTEFEVNTFGKNKILVKLFEGKVKIHALNKVNQFATVYLTQGQSLEIEKTGKPEQIRIKESPKKIIESVQRNQVAQLSFDHEALKDVFDKLSSRYNVNIVYDAQELEGLYFTGYLLESDTIKTILTLIANMNDLEIADVQGGFRVLKK